LHEIDLNYTDLSLKQVFGNPRAAAYLSPLSCEQWAWKGIDKHEIYLHDPPGIQGRVA